MRGAALNQGYFSLISSNNYFSEKYPDERNCCPLEISSFYLQKTNLRLMINLSHCGICKFIRSGQQRAGGRDGDAGAGCGACGGGIRLLAVQSQKH